MHCSERFMSDVAVVDRKSESRGGVVEGDKRSAPPFSISPPFAITEIHNIAVECATYLLYSSFLLSPVFFCFISLLLSSFFLFILFWKNDAVWFIFDDGLRIDSKGFPYTWRKSQVFFFIVSRNRSIIFSLQSFKMEKTIEGYLFI